MESVYERMTCNHCHHPAHCGHGCSDETCDHCSECACDICQTEADLDIDSESI